MKGKLWGACARAFSFRARDADDDVDLTDTSDRTSEITSDFCDDNSDFVSEDREEGGDPILGTSFIDIRMCANNMKIKFPRC